MNIAGQGLQGLRVVSLESRRQREMAALIENYGGVPISSPSMREVPVADNPAALAFAEDLLNGRVDVVIFLTGVGTRILFAAMESRFSREQLVEALSRTLVVARGPKPVAALRELGVPIAIAVPEPNTWRDLLQALDDQQPPAPLSGKQVAVQEYGESNAALLDGLRARGAAVTPVPVYHWALPEDLGPLREAVRQIAAGAIDVLLVTSAAQVHHLMEVATQEGLADKVAQGLRRAVVASIGPISSEALRSHGIAADFEPEHPKMGQLVFEAAQKAAALLAEKRGRAPR